MRGRCSRPNLFLLAVTIMLGAASSVQAHLVNTGFGPFYDGFMHLFVTPEDLLPVIAIALLAGLRGPRFGRTVLFALPVGWIAGSIIGPAFAPPLSLSTPEIILTLGLGALLAADWPLPLAVIAGLGILLGLMHGILNANDLAKTPSSGQLVLLGVMVALFISVSILAGQAASVQVMWARTVVRVVGSWIAAIGFLMLGWAMRAPA